MAYFTKSIWSICQYAKNYELEYSGPDLFFNGDDNYAHKAFQAAVGFISSASVYSVSINLVIQLTEEEVMESIREARNRYLSRHSSREPWLWLIEEPLGKRASIRGKE